MKFAVVVLVALNVTIYSQAAKRSKMPDKQDNTENRLALLKKYTDEVENELYNIELKINKLVYENLLDQASSGNMSIPIFALPTINAYKLYATVPKIGELHKAFIEANDKLGVILKRDPEYAAAREQEKQTGRSDATKGQLRSVYTRLHVDSPDYVVARTERDGALARQNIYITSYLLRYYQDRKMPMPTEGVIRSDARSSCRLMPEYSDLVNSRAVLEFKRLQLRKEYFYIKYGIE